MNFRNRQLIEGITLRARAFHSKVAEILDGYSAQMAAVKQESGKYADGYKKEFIESHNQRLVADARKELKAAAADFTEKTRKDAADLRDQLSQSLMEPLAPALESQLRTFRDYGIKPSRTQIETLLILNGENRLGIQAIDAVLTSSKADYSLKFTPVRQFEQDLEAIEQMTQCAEHFVPHDQFSAGCAVWRGVPVERTRPDGSTYPDGTTWDNIGLTINNASMNSLVRRIEEMPGRWAGGVTCEVAEAATQQFIDEEKQVAELHGKEPPEIPNDPPTTEIQEASKDGTALARELGKQNADAVAALRAGNYVR